MSSINAKPIPILRIVCGPTASGKSAISLFLAEKEPAEILSIDSMKVYRRLDLGTAKPDAPTRARVVHHLIDIVEPSQTFSVAEFEREAMRLIAEKKERRIALIGEGGTPLYLKALTEGLFAGPGRDDAIRAKLEQEAETAGLPALYARLQSIDKKACEKILPGDLRRVVRALEVYELTGKPISELQSQWGGMRTDIDVRLACVNLPRHELYRRIDARVDAMLTAGWLDECRMLMTLDPPLSKEASQALGYRTLFEHLNGCMSLKDARDRICFDTHHFARRQLNWFRHMPSIRFVEVAEDDDLATIAQHVENAWEHERADDEVR